MSDHDSTPDQFFVYFIRCGEFGAIKIGTRVGDPILRLKILQIGCPERLHLVGVIRNPPREHFERALHKKFRQFRIRGEWFTASRELMNFIVAYTEIPRRNRKQAKAIRSRVEYDESIDAEKPYKIEPDTINKSPDGICLGIPPQPVRRRGWTPVVENPFEQSKHIRALTYRVIDGLTSQQIADRMGISQRTVRTYIMHAKGYFGHPDMRVLRKELRVIREKLDSK